MQAKQWAHSVTLELIGASQGGDMQARERLVCENTPLVRSLAKRFLGKNTDYDDLMQVGQIGLLKAIAGFNPAFNVMFSTYAVPMILGEMKRHLRDNSLLKLSRSVKENFRKICAFQESFVADNGREPHLNEISAATGLENDQIISALTGMQQPRSLDEPLSDSDKSVLADMVPLEESGLSATDRMALMQCLQEMPPRDRQIIVLRYFKSRTQAAIAEKLGISQVQVSRIEAKVLRQLREKIQS